MLHTAGWINFSYKLRKIRTSKTSFVRHSSRTTRHVLRPLESPARTLLNNWTDRQNWTLATSKHSWPESFKQPNRKKRGGGGGSDLQNDGRWFWEKRGNRSIWWWWCWRPFVSRTRHFRSVARVTVLLDLIVLMLSRDGGWHGMSAARWPDAESAGFQDATWFEFWTVKCGIAESPAAEK